METPRPATPARDTGLPPGVAVGDLGRRLVAYLIDSIVPGVATALIAGVLPGSSGGGAVALTVVAGAATLAWALLCWWRLSVRAATPGMALMKLQLVGFLDGRTVGWGRVLVRWLVFTALGVTGIGLIVLLAFLLVHPRHQGWHDRAANAVVIVERPLAPPRTGVVDPPSVQAGSGAAAPPSARPATGAGEPEPMPVAAEGARSATARSPTDETDPTTDDTAGSSVAESAENETDAAGRRSILQGWVVVLDDGRAIDVDGLVLVGRNPQSRPGEEDARLVKLADESRTVSKTHLALGVDDAGLFVVDRGSTNGSTVTTPDRVSHACAPHTAVSVDEGSVVSIGDHWLRIRREPN